MSFNTFSNFDDLIQGLGPTHCLTLWTVQTHHVCKAGIVCDQAVLLCQLFAGLVGFKLCYLALQGHRDFQTNALQNIHLRVT